MTGGPATVLVVDDDRAVRALFRIALERAGHSVIDAADGDEALAVLADRAVDLVVLDQTMPVTDGLAVLAAIRADARTATLPVVLVTGAAGLDDRVRGLDAGADDYVSKPVHPRELVARVNAQLRARSTWSDAVSGILARRDAISRVLGGLDPARSIEEIAADLCLRVGSLDQVAGIATVVFDTERDGRVLAECGFGGPRVLPPTVVRWLRASVAEGPRVLDAAHVPGEPAPPWAVPGTALAPLGYAPLFGAVLVVPVAGGAGGPIEAAQEALAVAVDVGSVAGVLLRPAAQEVERELRRAALADCLRQRSFRSVFQPIVDLATGAITGFEALTRFDDGTPPGTCFAAARQVGLGRDLELATLERAVGDATRLPPGFVSLNVSPDLLGDGALAELVAAVGRAVVLEITEHDPIEDYDAVRQALASLAPYVRLSVDDAGAGYASLRHVLVLEPSFVKLDRSWVTGLDKDVAKRALVAGMASFATRTDRQIIAEGLESQSEMDAVFDAGVHLGQGYLLGRPMPAEHWSMIGA